MVSNSIPPLPWVGVRRDAYGAPTHRLWGWGKRCRVEGEEMERGELGRWESSCGEAAHGFPSPNPARAPPPPKLKLLGELGVLRCSLRWVGGGRGG